MTIVKLTLVVCLSLLALPSAWADLLTNPGFETGDFTGWTIGGNATEYGVGTSGQAIPGTDFGATTVVVHTGTYAAYGLVCNSSSCQPGSVAGPVHLDLSQTLSLVIGQTYTVGFYIADQSGTSGYGSSNAISVNGTALTVSQPSIEPYEQGVTASFVASSSTDTIDFRIQDSGSGLAGMSVDDFYVNGPAGNSVPEPASILLFATMAGLAGWVWARRGQAIC